jgi:hypothetical protein
LRLRVRPEWGATRPFSTGTALHILRAIGYAFMVLVLASGWAFFYWQSGSVDLAAVDAARAALADLRSVDNGWNQQLVNARLYARDAAPATPPPAAAPSQRHRLAYASLEVRALRLGDRMVGRELAQLKRAFEERASLIARFAEAQAALASLKREAPADETKLAEHRAIADVLFDQAWLASTGPRLDTLGRAIDRVFDEVHTQAELHRIGLLYYSGFLLAVLAFLVWNLARRRRN